MGTCIRNTDKTVASSIVCDCPELEINQMSIYNNMDLWTMIQPYNGTVVSNELDYRYSMWTNFKDNDEQKPGLKLASVWFHSYKIQKQETAAMDAWLGRKGFIAKCEPHQSQGRGWCWEGGAGAVMEATSWWVTSQHWVRLPVCVSFHGKGKEKEHAALSSPGHSQRWSQTAMQGQLSGSH